jgi:hypothetical protein
MGKKAIYRRSFWPPVFIFGIIYPAIANISWNVYGKIAGIQRNGNAANPVTTIKYTYDASGNRIGKAVWKLGDVLPTNTYYVRDASGNVMGIYESGQSTGYNLTQKEVHLYGSSRLGILNTDVNVQGGNLLVNSQGLVTFTRGNKFFELSNHLGNVLATISDKKIPVSGNGTLVDWYMADMATANDYYPFGMVMPGRKFAQAGKDYRYSINGQEKDKELNENITTALYWEYDSRIGRRWNVDPVVKEWESPYATFSNSPIIRVDPFGNSDTTVTSADGTQAVTLDNVINKLVFYQSSDNYIKGEPTKTPSKAGQLRSFSNRLGTFEAHWRKDADGNVVFAGYLNDKGQTWEVFIASLEDFSKTPFCKAMMWADEQQRAAEEDLLGYNLKVSFTLLSMGAMAAVDPCPYDIAPSGSWLSAADDFSSCYRPFMFPIKNVNNYPNFGMEFLDDGTRMVEQPFAKKGVADAVGGTIIKVENSPYLIVEKENMVFHISPVRVKAYVKNPLNPNSRWGDLVNFKKYGVPEGSEIIRGAGRGHKRTPTQGELDMFNNFFNK